MFFLTDGEVENKNLLVLVRDVCTLEISDMADLLNIFARLPGMVLTVKEYQYGIL